MLLVDLLKQHSIHYDLMQQIKQQWAKDIVFFPRRHIKEHEEERNGGRNRASLFDSALISFSSVSTDVTITALVLISGKH